ncbi:MAG: hypothetical protein R2809_11030 [Flavobacteriales bacterium]
MTKKAAGNNTFEVLLRSVNLDLILSKVTSLIRIALLICILIAVIILFFTPFLTGESNNNIVAGFFYLGFYSVIWGTIPSMILLIAIALDNKYRFKPKLQPIRTEVRFLTANVIIILLVATLIGLIRWMMD